MLDRLEDVEELDENGDPSNTYDTFDFTYVSNLLELNNPDKKYKYTVNLSNIYSLTPDTGAHFAGIEKESKRSSDSPAPLSFDMMFKTTEQQYGFGLHSPEQNDYDLYKR